MNEIDNQSQRQNMLQAASVSGSRRQNVVPASGNGLPDNGAKVANPDAAKQKAASDMEAVRAKVEQAVAKMNEYTQSTQRDLRFNLDDGSGRVVVNVVDRSSQEVVRQIPDEVFLQMARKLKDDLAAGNDQPPSLINVNA